MKNNKNILFCLAPIPTLDGASLFKKDPKKIYPIENCNLSLYDFSQLTKSQFSLMLFGMSKDNENA